MLYCPLLPQYTYPKRALALWDLIEAFIGEIIQIYYKDDAAVAEDVELQNVLRDLNDNGFHPGVGIPERFMDCESLQLFLCTIIYTCTVQHTIVSNGLLDYYGFCPNAVPGFLEPPPHLKRTKGLEPTEMKKLLPKDEDTLLLVILLKLMSETNQVMVF